MVLDEISTLSIDPDMQVSLSKEIIVFADETACSTPSESHELLKIAQASTTPFWDSVRLDWTFFLSNNARNGRCATSIA